MKETKYTAEMDFTGWLTLLFIALKLTGYINWSWWWVLSPILLSLLVLVVIILVFIGIWIFTE